MVIKMKTNNIERATYILLLAATTIITCIIIWFGFHAMNTAKDISANAITQMAELNNDIKDSDITKYDGLRVEGSVVVNCIKKYLGDYEESEIAPLYVTVTTGSKEYNYENGTYISKIRDFTDIHYIKPTATFLGDVIKNENDIILGIIFIQQ